MAKKKRNWKIWAVAAGAALVIGGLAGNGEGKAEPTRSAVVTEAPAPTAVPTPSPVPTPTPEPTATPEPTPTPYRIRGVDPQTTVYVSKNGVIHFKHDCSGMKNYTEMTLEKADKAGYKYCEHCG